MRCIRVMMCAGMSLTGLAANAQQPFPTYADSAQWSVSMSVMGVPYGTQVIRYTDTTTICGYLYSVLPDVIFGGGGYFRNEGQRTLFRASSNCADPERVIYDYSLAIGDTADIGVSAWDSPWGSGTSLFVVDTIELVMVSGVQRRRFKMTYQSCYDEGFEPFYRFMYWLEGVGSQTHPFFPLVCLCDGCELMWGLSCCDSSGVALYRAFPNVNCNENIGLDEISDEEQEQFTVIPLSGLLQPHYPTGYTQGTLRVFDVTGRECVAMRATRSQSTIPSANLPRGVLIAILTDDQGRQWITRWLNTS